MSQNPYEPPEHYIAREAIPRFALLTRLFVATLLTLIGMNQIFEGTCSESYSKCLIGVNSMAAALFLIWTLRRVRNNPA